MEVTFSKIVAPIERISGFVLLGSSAIRNLNGSFRRSFGNQ